VWDDPRVVLDPLVSSERFRAAMAAFNVGSTIKITGSGRHPDVDALLLDHVDLREAMIVDIGASDGSTSLDLIRRLPAFARYVIADLYITATAVQVGRRVVLLDHHGDVIVVSGPRWVGWPTGSRPVRLLYGRSLNRARRQRGDGTEVLLLNPEVRELIGRDERVTWQRHDVFAPWPGPTPDVIKVANLLRPDLYFTQDRIRVALHQLLTGLADGGHLLVADNPRAKVPACGTLYRREGSRFVRVAAIGPGAAIDALVLEATPAPPEAPRDRAESSRTSS
jgi:hypothetical protein